MHQEMVTKILEIVSHLCSCRCDPIYMISSIPDGEEWMDFFDWPRYTGQQNTCANGEGFPRMNSDASNAVPSPETRIGEADTTGFHRTGSPEATQVVPRLASPEVQSTVNAAEREHEERNISASQQALSTPTVTTIPLQGNDAIMEGILSQMVYRPPTQPIQVSATQLKYSTHVNDRPGGDSDYEGSDSNSGLDMPFPSTQVAVADERARTPQNIEPSREAPFSGTQVVASSQRAGIAAHSYTPTATGHNSQNSIRGDVSTVDNVHVGLFVYFNPKIFDGGDYYPFLRFKHRPTTIADIFREIYALPPEHVLRVELKQCVPADNYIVATSSAPSLQSGNETKTLGFRLCCLLSGVSNDTSPVLSLPQEQRDVIQTNTGFPVSEDTAVYVLYVRRKGNGSVCSKFSHYLK